MFICCICDRDNFISSTTLLAHMRLFHSRELKILKCKQPGCTRKFSDIRSFARHVTSHNSEVESTEGDRTENNISTNMDISDDSEIFVEVESSGSDRSTVDLTDFQRELFIASTRFVASLYNNDTLTKSHIQMIVNSQVALLKSNFVQVLKKKVMEIVTSAKHESEKVSEVEKMFNLYENMFDNLDTEYKRVKTFEKCGPYIKPEPYITGSALDDRHVYGVTSIEPVDLVGQFIPMRSVLKGFLELPGVWKKIDDYTNTLYESDGTILENVVQGKLWQKKIKPLFNGKTVLPLTLYFDEYETCDTGTHTGVHKLSAVYYNIPCIPPEFQSSLENIFTALIFYASDKAFGNYDVFRPVLNELLFLESEGITIVTDDNSEKQIYFALCLFLGDNLGIHSILGFVEGFLANFSCRRCKVHRDDARFQLQENLQLTRTRENYDVDVALANAKATGVKERCIWHELKCFHVTENISYDIMHDLDEGAWKYDMCNIIEALIRRNRFSDETLNGRIQGFAYQTCEAGNKPPIISKDHIKNKKLVFSAAEMLCFVRYFGLMIGDLIKIPEDEKLWYLYRTIRKIVDILAAPTIHIDEKHLLSNLVSEHHKLYLELFPNDNLKPKHHLMLHYGAILEDIGPLSRVSCLRFEGKHKPFKQVSRVSCNNKNLPFTLAVRHQLKLCYRLLCSNGLELKVATGPGDLLPVDSNPSFAEFSSTLPPDLDEIRSITWATISGTRYKKNMVLVVSLKDEFPVFGNIKAIFVDNKTNEISFLLTLYNTIRFNEHYHAYEVIDIKKWVFIKYEQLVSHVPTHIRAGFGGQTFITFRYQL